MKSIRFGAAAILTAAIVFVSACAPEQPASPGGTTAPPTTAPATYKEGRCTGNEGVTIVVDFAYFNNNVVVRCALGPQSSGFAVLNNTNFAHDPGNYPGTVCQLQGLPVGGHPYCWTVTGYWSYWKATSAGLPWKYSDWGAGAGPNPGPGAVEGWRFAPFADGFAQPPRIGTSGPIVP